MILFASLVFIAFNGYEAWAQTDSLYYSLDSTTFVTQKTTSAIRKINSNFAEVNLGMIQTMPQILGNTDPVNFIKNLPGVQTSTDYDSGIHIHGCDNAHNEISLAGVPIYGANHLFGIFSTFNPTHYTKMSFSRSAEGNWLGGGLRMELPDTLQKKVTGDLAVGIMSSQGTLGIKVGDKSHLRLSVRQSYMNLLYKRWLQIENSPIRYGFGDYNLSWLFNPTDIDKIWIEGYFGQDRTILAEQKFGVNLNMHWGNYSGAVHWKRNGAELKQHHTVFSSGFFFDGKMSQNESAFSIDSYIVTSGYKGHLNWRDFKWGAEINLHNILPQYPKSIGDYGTQQQGKERQTALESSLIAGYTKTFADRWNIATNLRGIFYLSPEKQYDLALSPDIAISYNAWRYGKVSASYGWSNQYLFQAGVTNVGLPVEFWFAAGKHSRPQYAQHAELTYDLSLFQDALALSVGGYYKRLYNQIEYKGDMFDFFNTKYDLDRQLLKGDGWNYGLNFMTHKQTGKLTGWISYSLGRALRRFNNKDYTGIYPANHERIHELNAVCAYQLRHWNFSSTFIYASGAPFTPPEYFYISAGQIMTKPSKHNSCRMLPYIRWDISVTYTIIKTKEQENGVNFSLYNVTGRGNEVMYRLTYNEGTYSYRSLGFFLKWMPSVSYYHKF